MKKEDKIKFRQYIEDAEYNLVNLNELIDKYYDNIFVDIDDKPLFGVIDINIYVYDDSNKYLIGRLNLLPSRKTMYFIVNDFDLEYIVEELLYDFGYHIKNGYWVAEDD